MTPAEEVRAAADIVKIVSDYVKLRKGGANMVGLCPFHQEKTPSFAVHPVKQVFHCFGCGVGGDVFKFVMLIENLSFPEALRRVAEKAGVKLRERAPDAVSDAAAREREVLYRIHELTARFFAAQLSGTAEGRSARAYLADRGLSDETVACFRLGYAPSEGHALLRHLAEAGFSAEATEKSGLVLAEAEGRRRLDRFRRRIIFPIARENGSVVAFGGRALGEDLPKYLNSPETPIYTKSRVLYHLDGAARALRQAGEAVLVEGYMDAIAVASAGFEQVVASCGTSLTESQVRLLARHTRRVLVNYDPDSAGLAAVERSLELLLGEGFECRVLVLPSGLDPDSFIRRQGAAAYGERLKAAPNYLDYLAERAAAAHNLRTPEGKVAALNAVLPYIVRVRDPILRLERTHQLADRLRVDDPQLRREVRLAAERSQREVRTPEAGRSLPASSAEKELLKGCLETEAFADEFLTVLEAEGALEGLPAAGIFRAIVAARRRGEKVEASQLEGSLDPTERSLLYECQFSDLPPIPRERAVACCRALRIRGLERKQDQVQAAIRLAEQGGDAQRLPELLRAKSKLAAELTELSRS